MKSVVLGVGALAACALLATACGGSDDACQTGESTCEGMQVVTCVDGQWAAAADCEDDKMCMAAAGKEKCMTPCTLGQALCDGQYNVHTCGTDGMWEVSNPCEGADTCMTMGGSDMCMAGH